MNPAPTVPARLRSPAVAGKFYPAHPEVLKRAVQYQFDLAAQALPKHATPKAVVAPHAGYPYSGPIAASAFSAWHRQPPRARQVILLGPSHYVSFSGLALSSSNAFDSPVGQVPVDQEACTRLANRGLGRFNDEAHRPEHALEVELPFLRQALGEFTLVPLLTGNATPDQVADALDCLWDIRDSVVVVSSDLSHYLDYPTAKIIDDETRQAVEAIDSEAIDGFHACGWVALAGLLKLVRARGLSPATVDLRNSGDTSDRRDRVVGYGAWWFE